MKNIIINLLISFRKKVIERWSFQTFARTHFKDNLFKPQIFKMKFIFGPLFQDFDVKLQKNFIPKETLDFFTSSSTYIFKHLALFADDDSFLRVSLNTNNASNFNAFGFLFKLFHNDCDRIWYFLPQPQKDFFPHKFACQKTLWNISYLMVSKVKWMRGDILFKALNKLNKIGWLQGRNRNNFDK